MRRGPVKRALSTAGHRAIILGFTAFAVFPFYWMVITAFKRNSDLYVGATNTAHNPFIFNEPPTLVHLYTLFQNTLYLTWLFNTLWVGTAVVLITLLLAVPAAYSLARLTGRWGERLSIGIFLTYLVPSTLLFIPFSRLVALLGLQNRLAALILQDAAQGGGGVGHGRRLQPPQRHSARGSPPGHAGTAHHRDLRPHPHHPGVRL